MGSFPLQPQPQRRRPPRPFTPPQPGLPLSINPEQAMPFDIPWVPDSFYDEGGDELSALPPPQQPQPYTPPPTPAADAAREFAQSQLTTQQPPGLGRRMALGALGAVAESRGLRGASQQAQMALQGIDPLAMGKQKVLSDLAELEAQAMERARRAEMDQSDLAYRNAQIQNLHEDNRRNRELDRERKSQAAIDDTRAYEAEGARLIQGTATRPGAVREIPTTSLQLPDSTPTVAADPNAVGGFRTAPKLPGARASFQNPGYTEINRTSPTGTKETLYQPPPIPGSAAKPSYRDQQIAAARSAEPAALLAIDGLEVPEEKKAMLRNIVKAAVETGDIPAISRATLGEVSNLNIRSRVTDPSMISARGTTARVVGQQGAQGRIEGEQKGLGGDAAAAAIQSQVETGERDVAQVPRVMEGKVATGMQDAGTIALPPKARESIQKLDAVERLLNQWEAAALKVNRYYGPQAVAYGLVQRAMSAAQVDPDAQELMGFQGRLGQIARGIGQEVGATSEGDISRAAVGLGTLGESEEITKRKFANMRTTVQNSRKALVGIYNKKFPRGGGGASPSTPPAVPSKLSDPAGIR